MNKYNKPKTFRMDTLYYYANEYKKVETSEDELERKDMTEILNRNVSKNYLIKTLSGLDADKEMETEEEEIESEKEKKKKVSKGILGLFKKREDKDE